MNNGARRIVPVVLAGGTGTRLWPVSRESQPKQFLPFLSERSLYQETLLRLGDDAIFEAPIVVTSEELRFFAQRQAAEIGIPVQVVLEPMRRDSAAALLVAAELARRQYGEALVLALAADHMIGDPKVFLATCLRAAAVAEGGRIVTFGVTPNAPSTAYGYIRPGQALDERHAFEIAKFVEKPDADTAARYVAEGYLWNSGNFMFPATLMLSEAEHFEPAIVAAIRAAIDAATEDMGFIRLDAAAFAAAPAKSIDYAVMERTAAAAVVAADFPWSDVGSWDGVAAAARADEAGNVTRGDVTLIDSRDAFVRSDGPFVGAIGLDNLAVIATDDAVLVMPKERCQDVKALVAQLKLLKRREASEHRHAYRPWGAYRTIYKADRTHVKKITVEPGAKLSLQRHHHRAEHWIVVRGTAEVTIDDKISLVHENQSVYIPMGSVHRLANPGKIDLELIEVQTGSYLEEDDIVRLDDQYRRV